MKETSIFVRIERFMMVNSMAYKKISLNEYEVMYKGEKQRYLFIGLLTGFTCGAGVKLDLSDDTGITFKIVLGKRS